MTLSSSLQSSRSNSASIFFGNVSDSDEESENDDEIVNEGDRELARDGVSAPAGAILLQ